MSTVKVTRKVNTTGDKPTKRKANMSDYYGPARAKALLEQLKNDHDFDLIKEIMKTYQMAMELTLLPERIQWRRSIERDLMSYCFPKLRTTEVTQKTDKTIINFTIPAPESHAKLGGEKSLPQLEIDSDGD